MHFTTNFVPLLAASSLSIESSAVLHRPCKQLHEGWGARADHVQVLG